MAGLRVFVSSTCFDLAAQRSQIRGLLMRMGYEPVMSDHSDVLFDPRMHTHTSCIKEVINADMMILLIGHRFGGGVVPEALSEIDLKAVSKSSTKSDLVKESDKLSITQVEVLKAIESDIPLFAFVDSKVHADHHLYQTNKHKSILSEIDFPSIDKQSSARYIFEFINLITHRFSNNSIIPYSSFSDIEDHLIKQWSMMFQRFLREERESTREARKADAILEQIQDIKAAVLQSMPNETRRKIARSVVRFRRLVDFLIGMQGVSIDVPLTNFAGTFDDLLSEFGVLEIRFVMQERSSLTRTVLIRESDYLIVRVPDRRFSLFNTEWKSFSQLDEETKQAVLDGVSDIDGMTYSIINRVSGPFEEEEALIDEITSEDIELPTQPADQIGGSWTEERLEKLRSMWADGQTASQIAEALGGVSRNAVIGKAHRLGLKSRPVIPA